MEPVAVPILPAPVQPVTVARETQAPMGMERHRDDRGVMGPVLEGRPRAVVHPAQRGGPVGRTPRPEDQVMGARQRVDAVDLNEAQPLDESASAAPFAGPAGGSSSAWRCRNSRRAVGFVSSVTLTARAPCDHSYEQSHAPHRSSSTQGRVNSPSVFEIAASSTGPVASRCATRPSFLSSARRAHGPRSRPRPARRHRPA
jgi:hypothetical protein